MNLENFIVESIRQIVVGVNKARDTISQINRENDVAEQFLFQAVNLEKGHGNQDVDFDVALTVVEEATCSQLFVVGLKHHISGSFEQLVSLASRVKFSVPLSYVQGNYIKKFAYTHSHTERA
jgi:hypothetical protein